MSDRDTERRGPTPQRVACARALREEEVGRAQAERERELGRTLGDAETGGASRAGYGPKLSAPPKLSWWRFRARIHNKRLWRKWEEEDRDKG